jgi:hypothetical protein
VLDVLNIYLAEKAPKHARPEETKQRILTLADFWQPYMLADVNGQRCREYVESRVGRPWKSAKPDKTNQPPRLVTAAAARRELEDLRAAINYHRLEGLCCEVVSVALPEKFDSRVTWLTRSEAARIIRAAWRAKQIMWGNGTKRDVGKHIARFLLVGLYTGTRHAAICGAAFQPAIGRGHVDLDRGVFHRLAQGARETKKRQPPGPPTEAAFNAPTALASAWHSKACRGGVERQASSLGPEGIRRSSGRGGHHRKARYPTHIEAHFRDLDDAGRRRPLAGGWLPRHDGRDVGARLRPSSPQLSGGGRGGSVGTETGQKRREQKSTGVIKWNENHRTFKGSSMKHNVRDEGVAGSNPATPTIT